MLSMPDCLEAGSKHKFQYEIRIRLKNQLNPHYFLHGHVCFHQYRDATTKRGFFQQSIVVITEHPFADLSFKILHRITEVLEAITKPNVLLLRDASNPDVAEIYTRQYDAIEVAFQHFRHWPQPIGGNRYVLPFYGDMFDIHIPLFPPYIDPGIYRHCMQPAERPDALGDGSTIYGYTNLLSVLQPLGLLPYLWTLWELVITGQDILVWAPSADMCSRLVTTLVSLAAPLVYGGDYRPYLNPYDTDVASLTAAVEYRYQSSATTPTCVPQLSTPPRKKKSAPTVAPDVPTEEDVSGCRLGLSIAVAAEKNGKSKSPPIIIGITNPFLLRSFSHIQNAIFLPGNKPPSVSSKVKKSVFSSRSSSHEKHVDSGFSEVATVLHPLGLNESLEDVYDNWLAASGVGSKGHVLLCTRRMHMVVPDRHILQRALSSDYVEDYAKEGSGTAVIGTSPVAGVASHSSNDWMFNSAPLEKSKLVGNMLLREHFRQLTCSLMKPFLSHFQITLASPAEARDVASHTSSYLTQTLLSSLSYIAPSATSLFSWQESSQKKPPQRANTFIYRNPLEYLMHHSIPDTIRKYHSKHIPHCFLSNKRSSLFNAFASSETFQAWYNYRRETLEVELLLQMAEICCEFSDAELLRLYAQEVHSSPDQLTRPLLQQLADRIEQAIRRIKDKIPFPSDLLLEKMTDHMNSVQLMIG